MARPGQGDRCCNTFSFVAGGFGEVFKSGRVGVFSCWLHSGKGALAAFQVKFRETQQLKQDSFLLVAISRRVSADPGTACLGEGYYLVTTKLPYGWDWRGQEVCRGFPKSEKCGILRKDPC